MNFILIFYTRIKWYSMYSLFSMKLFRLWNSKYIIVFSSIIRWSSYAQIKKCCELGKCEKEIEVCVFLVFFGGLILFYVNTYNKRGRNVLIEQFARTFTCIFYCILSGRGLSKGPRQNLERVNERSKWSEDDFRALALAVGMPLHSQHIIKKFYLQHFLRSCVAHRDQPVLLQYCGHKSISRNS